MRHILCKAENKSTVEKIKFFLKSLICILNFNIVSKLIFDIMKNQTIKFNNEFQTNVINQYSKRKVYFELDLHVIIIHTKYLPCTNITSAIRICIEHFYLSVSASKKLW